MLPQSHPRSHGLEQALACTLEQGQVERLRAGVAICGILSAERGVACICDSRINGELKQWGRTSADQPVLPEGMG